MSDQEVPPVLLSELKLSYPWQVAKTWWRLVGHGEYALGLGVWLIALLVAGNALDSGAAEAVQTWLVVGLGVLALVSLVIVAPIQLGLDVRSKLIALLDVPEVEAEVGRPFANLVRVRITNRSPGAHEFAAQVVGTENIPPGPEVPWPVPWRHSKYRIHRLYPGQNEMLKMARLAPSVNINGAVAPGGHFNISKYDGEEEEGDAFHIKATEPVDTGAHKTVDEVLAVEGHLNLKVWHVGTGRLVKNLRVSMRPMGTPMVAIEELPLEQRDAPE